MITHVVAFRWKPGISADQLAVIESELAALPSLVPAIRSYQFGVDLGAAGPANFDYAIVSTFDDLAGWRSYDAHPEHERVRVEHIRPWLAERAAVQFES